jgi:hypothetical protein
MGRWLDAHLAEPAETSLREKKTQNAPCEEPSKPSKLPFEGFEGFEGSQGSHISQPEVRHPRGYTDAELDAARLDAERLGYGRRLH